jgi:hypothetical protein
MHTHTLHIISHFTFSLSLHICIIYAHTHTLHILSLSLSLHIYRHHHITSSPIRHTHTHTHTICSLSLSFSLYPSLCICILYVYILYINTHTPSIHTLFSHLSLSLFISIYLSLSIYCIRIDTQHTQYSWEKYITNKVPQKILDQKFNSPHLRTFRNFTQSTRKAKQMPCGRLRKNFFYSNFRILLLDLEICEPLRFARI